MKTYDKKFKCLEHVLHENLVHTHIRLFITLSMIGCRIGENPNNNSKALVLKTTRRRKTIGFRLN